MSVQRPISKRNDVGGTVATAARRLVRSGVSRKAVKQGFKTCPVKSINAAHVDDLVRGRVLDHLEQRHRADLRSQEPEARDHGIRGIVHRVVAAPDRIIVEMVHNKIAACVDEAREIIPSRAADTASL